MQCEVHENIKPLSLVDWGFFICLKLHTLLLIHHLTFGHL